MHPWSSVAAMLVGVTLSCVLLLVMPIPRSAAEFSAEEYEAYSARLANSPHDFTLNRRFAILVEGEAEPSQKMCIYCHPPRDPTKGAAPRLSPLERTATEFYAFGYVGAGGKEGASRLMILGDNSLICLSCHDGVYGDSLLVGAPGEHPIGVVYPVDQLSAEYRAVSGWSATLAFFDRNANGKPDAGEIRVFRSGAGYTVECASCHDAHGPEKVSGDAEDAKAFLRIPRVAMMDICITCHIK